MNPFYFTFWKLKKNGFKNFVLDLNRTQMFSEQLLKKDWCSTEKVPHCVCLRHLREEQMRSVCNYFGIQATWVSLPILTLSLRGRLNDSFLLGSVRYNWSKINVPRRGKNGN